jgi:hypothetical protein
MLRLETVEPNTFSILNQLMKKSIILASILISLIAFSCKNNEEQEVRKVVETFYKENKTVDFRDNNKALFSKDLSMLIDKTIAREALSAARILKSDYPTDKPLMVEGDIFSSLYEGTDSLKILEVKIEASKAIVTVEYKQREVEKPWKDEYILVNEQGWKIDNVIFKSFEHHNNSTKTLLLDLINTKD